MPDNEGATSHVSVKVPPFYAHDIELWFINLEGQFSLANITRQITKFYYVVGNLPPEHSRQVRQLLKEPKEATAYDDLKEALIKSSITTLQERLQQLVDKEELGDRKPSQFLGILQSLMGEVPVSDELMRGFFLRRMPPTVCAVLAALPADTSTAKLATAADAIIAAAPTITTPPINQVEKSNTTASSASATGADGGASYNSRMDRLEKQVEELTKQVKRLTYRNRSRSRSRSQSSAADSNKQGLCFYHKKFGDKARHCESPCTYSKNE